MSLPRRRRSRPKGRARLALVGGIPDSGEADTEQWLSQIRPADWDGTTVIFAGASDAGLPGGAYPQPAPPSIAPPPDVPGTLPPAAYPDNFDPMARVMARGWPRLFEIRCAYLAAACDTPIPCAAVHRDDSAPSFRDLRRSAFTTGWHLDMHGQWACPGCCQASPEYRTLYPLTVWDAEAAEARLDGDEQDEQVHRAVAEHDLFRRVLDTARRGRHAGGAR